MGSTNWLHVPRRRASVVAVAAAVLTTTVAVAEPSPQAEAATTSWSATVTRVIDGDTFEAKVGGTTTTVRVAGLNTHERWEEEPQLSPECLSYTAKQELRGLIEGKTVTLRARSAASQDKERDLRHVFLGSQNIATVMLERGMGIPIRFGAEPDHSTTNTRAAWRAAKAGRGIWDSDACGVGPAASAEIEMVTHFDAAGNDTTNPRGEYVQLRNRSDVTVDLTGWTLRDTGLSRWRFPSGTKLGPHGRLRVHVGKGTNTSTSLYMNRSRAMLSNTADGMFLHDTDFDIRAYDMWPCTGSCGEVPPLVIDEVSYNAPGSDTSNPNGEWFRIRNVGDRTVDLQDWVIDSPPYQLSSIASRPIAPNGYVTIYVGRGTNTRSTMYLQRKRGVLGNTGDVIKLLTPNRDIADCVAWGSFTCGSGQESDSRLVMTLNWNAAGNDLKNPNGEWVNLTNTTSAAIDLTGHTLVSPPHTFAFPKGTSVAPRKRLRVRIGSGKATSSTLYWGKSTGILNNSGDRVSLIDPGGDVVRHVRYPCVADCGPPAPPLVIDAVNFNAPGNDLTNPNGEWIRIRNASSRTIDLRDWQIETPPYQINPAASRRMRPGETVTIYVGPGANTSTRLHWAKSHGILNNSGDRVRLWSPDRQLADCVAWGSHSCGTSAPSGALVLTAHFDAEGDDTSNPNGEWVNIENQGPTAVDLGGAVVNSGSIVRRLPSGTKIAAGDRLRIYIGPGSASSGRIHLGYSSGMLANSGGRVTLFAADGTEITSHGWSCGSATCPSAAPIQITTVNFDAPGDDRFNPNGEYVRVRNNAASPVDLRDWAIVSAPYVYDISRSLVLAPSASVTVRIGAGTDSSTTYYWGQSSSILANGGETVELFSPARERIDCVDWGSASC